MRFVFNFFFYGFLFYLIWLFFPEAFHTLQNWAGSAFTFFKEIFSAIATKLGGYSTTPPAPSAWFYNLF